MTKKKQRVRYSLSQHINRSTHLTNLRRNWRYDLEDFNEERTKLHREIQAKYLKHGRKQQQPKVIVVMGGIAAGKSTLIQKLSHDCSLAENHYIMPDADKLKDEIIERQYRNATDKVALIKAIHREAVLLRNRILYHAMNRKYNVLIETMGASRKYLNKMLHNLQDAGYVVEVHYVETPENLASQRLLERNAGQQRQVPASVGVRTRLRAQWVYNHSNLANIKYTKWLNTDRLNPVSERQHAQSKKIKLNVLPVEKKTAIDFRQPKPTSIVQDTDNSFYSTSVGLLMPSKKLKQALLKNAKIERKHQGHFTIKPGTVVEGSSRFGGICPDVLYEDFKLDNYSMSFLALCHQIGKNQKSDDAQKITRIKNIVRELVTLPITIDDNNKRYYGSDYNNPNWTHETVMQHKNLSKVMPVAKFAELGFGDCRITNGLLCFGLQQAGYDVSYSYKKVLTYPRWIRNSFAKLVVKFFWRVFTPIQDTIKRILGIPTEDHAVCIMNLQNKRVILDAYNPNYDGFDIKRVNMEGVNSSNYRDIPHVESDAENEHSDRKTESSHKNTFLKTNSYPLATIREDAQEPYPQKCVAHAYKNYQHRVQPHIKRSAHEFKSHKHNRSDARQILQQNANSVGSPVNLGNILNRRNSI